ncbi:hypothetical protein [Helicobacter sp.]|uniref:hypothetical protein n=1 Tax=Helicobacter sp. TaxID=218 RepID=UPI002A90B2AE|nr:hypothetical protein [Helicobacter sp.]MDY5556640.1 hypothetical protein [Helicobacter sp.]
MESLKSRLGYRFASVGELLTQRTLRYAHNDVVVTFCHCEAFRLKQSIMQCNDRLFGRGFETL